MMEDNYRRKEVEARDHVSVEIEHQNQNVELVAKIKKKIETVSPSRCICRVPMELRQEDNEKIYTPHLVSIGPLHHNKQELRGMEEHKLRYLHSLLCRKPTLEATLDSCVKAIKELEQRARKCYEGDIELRILSSDEFVEMMILDGCFIIELFLKYAIKGLRRKGDPLFSKKWVLSRLRCDLLLLENQLPLFVLRNLFDLLPVPKQCAQSLPELAFRLFEKIIPGYKQALQKKFIEEGTHLLDLLRNCLLPSIPIPILSRQQDKPINVHSATKLRRNGVSFKKAWENSLLDVQLVNGGVLEIPPVDIKDYTVTESILRNLVALEKCYNDDSMYISSYCRFMGSLINSPTDVSLLSRRGIILRSATGTEEQVIDLFKSLSKGVVVHDFCYAGLCEKLNAYRCDARQEWWTKVKNANVKTPKSFPLFVVIIILLLLIFAGTLFSILSFFLRKS
ncbi:PREDICTED: UPF0481 protein At3g47200-like [Nelumbo nucifera]|uniref:UPF0481 protein At3g47200-like n=2 Tax=Nelumbo nucifera TaxID=4432 RepID=A0A1U8A3A8_NELNU|nr:PREDICTED: UPF0481 protein At3g47200-like [Nelumbo nucifera]XP_010259281.1 PREDICTED: UPF0481 protein At3g47200-like [Nelumbo nucifera]XP_010259282.1 PREDICTED: UPF0481 protein At3g47200-like [Nelumbo nucifera]XP_010259283.1 PREDICTED: UPF0481 protein At3g47200-like [Nelumbo nucifera]XP_019053559.1 PREDICTED: UPF0481 protein At3g47200-like [Nelumbo nucifera]DAD38273.1 TPA_asm: hypothetical protein HUJ06_008914 [Nelumbo nucifera]